MDLKTENGPLSGRVGSFQMHPINKIRRFQDLKSAAKLRQGRLVPVGRSREIARRCTYHTRRKSCGNTGLLTCVREQMLLRPHPTFSQVFPAMADISSRRFNRFGVASRAQHRFVSALRPSSLRPLPEDGGSGVYYGIYSVFGEAERAASDAFIVPYIISERGVFCKRIFGQFPLRRLFQVGRVNLPGRWGRRRRNTDRGAVGTAFPWA